MNLVQIIRPFANTCQMLPVNSFNQKTDIDEASHVWIGAKKFDLQAEATVIDGVIIVFDGSGNQIARLILHHLDY